MHSPAFICSTCTTGAYPQCDDNHNVVNGIILWMADGLQVLDMENIADCDDEDSYSWLVNPRTTLALLLEILYVPYFHVIKPSTFDYECF